MISNFAGRIRSRAGSSSNTGPGTRRRKPGFDLTGRDGWHPSPRPDLVRVGSDGIITDGLRIAFNKLDIYMQC
jgi:hypothetical protein